MGRCRGQCLRLTPQHFHFPQGSQLKADSGVEDSPLLLPAAMGAAESFPATPTSKPFLNKHLAHVSDPRSPTPGILRTPIEVRGDHRFILPMPAPVRLKTGLSSLVSLPSPSLPTPANQTLSLSMSHPDQWACLVLCFSSEKDLNMTVLLCLCPLCICLPALVTVPELCPFVPYSISFSGGELPSEKPLG